jgi:hypothetical protein
VPEVYSYTKSACLENLITRPHPNKELSLRKCKKKTKSSSERHVSHSGQDNVATIEERIGECRDRERDLLLPSTDRWDLQSRQEAKEAVSKASMQPQRSQKRQSCCAFTPAIAIAAPPFANCWPPSSFVPLKVPRVLGKLSKI